MIEKNNNYTTNKQLGRILQVDPEIQQITLLDSRFYKIGEEFYPSVTTILTHFPKDKFFETWVKDVGHNADLIIRRAGDEGTEVHKAVEEILAGEELHWIDERGYFNYNLEVWKMILKFVDFWTTHKPKLLHSEVFVHSKELRTGGTVDLIVEIDGEVWILDLKTSNAVYKSYEIQTAVYRECWNELYEEKVTRTGILWLKASTRGPDKTGKKIQGAGWEIKFPKSTQEDNIETFKNLYKIYKIVNPDDKPYSEKYPNIIKLDTTI
jgi:hypothetical protein